MILQPDNHTAMIFASSVVSLHDCKMKTTTTFFTTLAILFLVFGAPMILHGFHELYLLSNSALKNETTTRSKKSTRHALAESQHDHDDLIKMFI